MNPQSLKERLQVIDGRETTTRPPANDEPETTNQQSEPKLNLNADLAVTSAFTDSSTAWVRKARHNRRRAHINHALSWMVALVIGGAIFAGVAILLFGPGPVIAALHSLPLM